MTDIEQLHDIRNTMNNMDLEVIQRMIFIYNALENGWNIKKNSKNLYSFTKNHNNNKEYFSNDYITTFIKENINLKNMFSLLSKEIE